MKNVIVIGADNALGQALLKLLIDRGIRAVAIASPSSANKNAIPTDSLIKLFECKPSELPMLAKKLTEDYDALFYVASDKPVRTAPESAELAARLGCAVFIGAGSQAELRPFEDDPYGAAMLAAGKLCASICRKNGLRFSWLRLSNLYGPYDSEESFVASNIISLVSGGTELLLPEEDGEFDFISAEDAAKALLLAAELAEPKEFYDLISEERAAAQFFAEKMAAVIAPGVTVSYSTDANMRLFKNGAEASLTLLSDDTGFRPALTFEEALPNIVPWAKETWEKNKKRARLCGRICDMAMTQYDSGDLQGSLKSFFQILGFKKYLYTETITALDQLFAEGNQEFYRENFNSNLKYFGEKGLADFDIEADENNRLYYAGDLIRLHNLSDDSFQDLEIQDIDEDNPPAHLKVSITYAGLIIDCDESFSQSMTYAEKHYTNTDIYIFAQSQSLLLAYMRLMKFDETELNIVKIFSSAAEMEDYFRSQNNRYMPKSIITKDPLLAKKIFSRLEEVSVARRSIPRENSDSVILTIGIPSANRGKLLLEKIKYILNIKRDIEFELFVAVNYWGETAPECVDEIRTVKDSRFRLIEREANIGAKTFADVFDKSRGKYCFIISDEDFFNLKIFDYLLQKLSELKNTAIYKMTGTFQGRGLKSAFYKKGAEALLNFNFNNYISGTIYNRDLFLRSQAGTSACELLDSGNMYARWYFIPVMDMYMCTAGDVILDSTLGYIDNGPQAYYEELKYDQGIPMIYARPETRMEQYEDYTAVLLDIAKRVNYDPGIVYGMFINYSARNFFLISCVESVLSKRPEGADPAYIMVLEYSRGKVERFNKEYFPLAGIKEGSPEALQLTKIFHDTINQTVRHYLKEPDKYASYFNKN